MPRGQWIIRDERDKIRPVTRQGMLAGVNWNAQTDEDLMEPGHSAEPSAASSKLADAVLMKENPHLAFGGQEKDSHYIPVVHQYFRKNAWLSSYYGPF